MIDSEKINEFKAAVEFAFSPDLLRWFTANPVLDNEILPFKEEDGIYYFSRSDIKRLDTKMHGKWPLPSKGSRPTIPAGIKREIKEEAQFACPVCHRAQGELAHIHSVATTFCNHPANLLYLCPNHHAEYDFGHIFQNVSVVDVRAFKESLRRFNKIQWSLKGKIIETYLGSLNTAKSLLEVHKVIKDSIDDEKFNTILMAVTKSIEEKKGKAPGIQLTIESLEREIDDYKTAHSSELCPLCGGQGSTSLFHPCPICWGDGIALKDDPRLGHLEDFKPVDCKLCDGTGTKNNDVCPACGGEQQVPRGWAGNHDWSQYDDIDCNLCDGTGSKNNDVCPACGGEQQVRRGWAENHDWSQYES